MRAVLVSALLLAGCAGTAFEWDNAKQVRIGTTEVELISLIGKPYIVKSQPDGSQVWVWSYASGFTGTRFVSFSLKDGRVSAVPNMSQFN